MRSSLPRIVACLLASGAMAVAQSNRPAPLNSPVVHPDRTVTFSVRAPSAKKVELSAQFLKGGHTWMNARHYLAETLQLYFRK